MSVFGYWEVCCDSVAQTISRATTSLRFPSYTVGTHSRGSSGKSSKITHFLLASRSERLVTYELICISDQIFSVVSVRSKSCNFSHTCALNTSVHWHLLLINIWKSQVQFRAETRLYLGNSLTVFSPS